MLSKSFLAFVPLISSALAALPALSTPFHTQSRWIMDANNKRFKMRCVNWPGHMEANIPEGLQHQPADKIAGWIADQGFNCVRLTYSIDMALDPTLSVKDSFDAAASAAGVPLDQMRSLYSSVSQQNPDIAQGNVLGAFDAVISALSKHNVAVILDNHVSKAGWCCSQTDGSGWPDEAGGYNADNSRYFNTTNWYHGLSAMATHVSTAKLSNVVGMSVRNELRPVAGQDGNGYADWYKFIPRAADAIHSANSNLLVVLGGVNYALDLSFLYNHPIDSSVAWRSQTVWEFHLYPFSIESTSDCTGLSGFVGAKGGYVLEQDKPYTGPFWLSEFGVGMTGGPNNGLSDGDRDFMNCLSQYMTGNDAEWAVWGVQGDYYVRSGQVSSDESYGLLDKDWKDWRNPAFLGMLGGMMNVTQGP